ncbi:MAG: hypothetical protein U0169_10330 [Polyangiaceae bacterium]
MASASLHLAVLPFVRGGAYVTYDASKTANGDFRHFVAGGLRAKLVSPFPERPFRTWLFLGTGYTRAFDSVASGGFVEIPVGVGISYEIRKPYQLSLELGGRFGFGFHGAAYDASVLGRFAGSEFAAVFASAGITFDR